MSKLAKYRKPPVVRLPISSSSSSSSSTSKVQGSVVKPSRWNDEDDDDDDFKVMPVKVVCEREEVKGSDGRKSKSQSSASASSSIRETSTSVKVKAPLPLPPRDGGSSADSGKVKDEERKVKLSKEDIKRPTDKNRKEKDAKKEEAAAPAPPVTKPESLCPFCWKKLNDKLTGTVHLKACAKNLPTNQIFEALQLQEKQIKEWENLGISYPGFKGNAPSRGGGTNVIKPKRQRKPKVDPEIELAMALSASLHEEVQRREQKGKEDTFLLLSSSPTDPIPRSNSSAVSTSNKPDDGGSKRFEVVTLKADNPIKKRGKKQPTADLPLFKTSSNEKKTLIERRLNDILDENMKASVEEFYVRTPPTTKGLRVPERLQSFADKECTLWKLSSSDEPSSSNHGRGIHEILKSLDQDVKEVLQSADGNSGQATGKESVISKRTEGVKTKDMLLRPKKIHSLTKESISKSNSSQSLSDRDLTLTPRSSSQEDVDALNQIANDMLRMFVNKVDADLTVYGREEKSIRCHKFIIKARCPKLYPEIVTETTAKGVRKDMIALTSYSHVAVKAFVKFLYCGRMNKLAGLDMEDVSKLCTLYGVKLLNSSSNDVVPVEEASTCTEPKPAQTKPKEISLHEPSEEPGSNFQKSDEELELKETHTVEELGADSGSTVNAEIFSWGSWDGKLNSEDDHTFAFEVIGTSPAEILNDGGEGSRDMFDDDEFGLDHHEKTFDLTLDPRKEDGTQLSSTSTHERVDKDDYDIQFAEELLTQDNNCITQLSSNQYGCKRDRSLSPPRFGKPYTASQLAEFLEREPGVNSQDYNQATKKHKLDVLSPIVEKQSFTFSSPYIIDSEPQPNANDKLFSTTPQSRNSHQAFSLSPLPTISPIGLSPTPSNPGGNTNPSSFQNKVNPSFSIFDDPFGGDGDGDSCFLNVPSVLVGPETSQVRSVVHPILIPTTTDTTTNILRQSNNKGQQQKAGASKKKQGRRRALSQEQTPRTPIPIPTDNTRGREIPNMLDYSTIDTPILKRELKRYGLKPLPRSKAKLILRHIVRETNK